MVLAEGTGRAAGSREGGGRAGGDRAGRVERMCMRASFEWPFAVAKLLGRCLEIRSAVKPGQEEKKPLFIAAMKVLGTGLKTARW